MSKQITFRGMAPDELAMQQALHMVDRLEGHFGDFNSCAVVIQRNARRNSSNVRYDVSLQVQRATMGQSISASPRASGADLGKTLHIAFRRADTSLARRISRRRGRDHLRTAWAN